MAASVKHDFRRQASDRSGSEAPLVARQNLQFPFSTYARRIYILTLLVRLILAVGPGYIHPDEHFQSTEVMAGAIFNTSVDLPWEWKAAPPGPSRSVLGPYLTLGLPFQAIKWMSLASGWAPSAVALFLLPRMTWYLLSLTVDYSIYRICLTQGLPYQTALLLFSSSYTTGVFLVRPFSNSFLAMVVAWLLAMTCTDKRPHLSSTICLGSIIMMAFFARPDAVAFLSPMGAHFFLHTYQRCASVRDTLFQWMALGATLLVTLVAGVVVDSIYFGTLRINYLMAGGVFPFLPSWNTVDIKGMLTFTFLNNIRYNLDPANLALHGIHPRWLHFVVNMPLLFGPLFFWCIFRATVLVSARTTRTFRIWQAVSISSMGLGLTLLSSAPHQEPRFLLPILVPLVVLTAKDIHGLSHAHSRIFWISWFSFNSVLAVYFGVLHQGGVVPSLVHLERYQMGEVQSRFCQTDSAGREIDCPIVTGNLFRSAAPGVAAVTVVDPPPFLTRIVYWKLFTPPRHLLHQSRLPVHNHLGRIHHLAGAHIDRLIHLTTDLDFPLCQDKLSTLQNSTAQFVAQGSHYHRFLVVCPRFAATRLQVALQHRHLRLSRLWVWNLHIDFDHVGQAPWADKLGVGVWQVCKEARTDQSSA